MLLVVEVLVVMVEVLVVLVDLVVVLVVLLEEMEIPEVLEMVMVGEVEEVIKEINLLGVPLRVVQRVEVIQMGIVLLDQ